MSSLQPRPDASEAQADSDTRRRLAHGDRTDGLRMLLHRFAGPIRHTTVQLDAAFQKYLSAIGHGTANKKSREKVASLLRDLITDYRELRQQVARLPLSDFNGRRDLRDQMLTSLDLTERGLMELVAGTHDFGTPTAKAELKRAAGDLNSGHALGHQASKALHLHP
jgi:hypothetical protein